MALALMIATAMAQAAPQAPAVTVEVKEIGAAEFRITLMGYEADDRQSQAAISGIVRQVCDAKSPVWGKYEATRQLGTAKDGKTTSARFVQLIRCVEPTDPAPAAPRRAFTPDAATESTVRAIALDFLADYEGGDGAASWNLLSGPMKQSHPLADWQADVRKRGAAIGATPEHRIAKLTLYVDPPNGPPGIFAALDYAGKSRKQAFLCGYVALVRGSDDQWSVARVESGSIPVEVAQGAAPDHLLQLKQAIRCVEE